MAVNLSPIWGAGAQLFDNSGNVLSGGKIYTYAAGTTTPATTYTSSNGITANSNPIILNSAGRVPYEIWLSDTVAYKFVLKDSNDTLIATYDNLVGINSNFIAYTAQQEIQTATAGQTVFNLTTMQYQPATNNLSVFVDGVNQYGPGAQYAYVETDSDTVTFVSGLHVGASVKFTTASPVAGAVMNAENVAYDPPFTGAVGTNVEAKLAQTVSVKDFGAVGDGVTDDTDAIQNAIDAITALGGGYIFFPTGTYKVTQSIILKNGCGLVSDNSAEIYAPAANFNNTDLSIANRYGTNAVVINASGLTIAPYTQISDISIKNLKITSEVSDGRVVTAIVARNVVNLEISGCEITGFPVGCGISVATISGNSFISNNYIHDFTSNAVWASQPQITAIEVDNDRINSVATVDLNITGNNIRNLTVGATIIASWGYQTDGIKVINQYSSRVRVINNNVKYVGQGIDYYGRNGVVSNNTISDAYIFGIKLIHGASKNVIANNNIENAGLGGISVNGSNVAGVGDTQWNLFCGNVIDNIDPSSVWAANETAGILIAGGVGVTYQAKNNTFVGNTINLGVNGKYGWFDSSAGTNNIGTSITVIPGAGIVEYVVVLNAAGAVQLTGSTTYLNRGFPEIIASASTIAPKSGFVFVSDVTTINTITPPDFVITGRVSSITIVPTGLWSTGTSGNIMVASTAIPYKPIIFTYDASRSKWYPSY